MPVVEGDAEDDRIGSSIQLDEERPAWCLFDNDGAQIKRSAMNRRDFRLASILGLGMLVVGTGWAGGQTFTEYDVPTADSDPLSITLGPDGAMWFTEEDGGQIGRIDAGGTMSQFPVAITRLGGITTGPDGNLWFTEPDADRIGRMTPAGVVSHFPRPTSDGTMTGWITSGPDGNLWYGVINGLNPIVGRTTTGGVITEFQYSHDVGSAFGIAAGSDGNLWFAAPLEDHVGRITPAGVTTSFPMPVASSGPRGITSGSDDNLWITEGTGNAIARMTTSGAITEFPVPTPASFPSEITSAPDGTLWFTERDGNKVARITTSGDITEYSVPTPASGARGIAAGPDGSIWFTEVDANKIGRLSLGAPAACVSNGSTLCLNNQRFRVTASWQKTDGSTGSGTAIPLTADAGYFWFFNSANIELVVKALNACSLNPPRLLGLRRRAHERRGHSDGDGHAEGLVEGLHQSARDGVRADPGHLRVRYMPLEPERARRLRQMRLFLGRRCNA